MGGYLEHLFKDRKLKKILIQQQPFVLESHDNLCLRLCASVMSQQLSTKVAQVIYQRFLALFHGDEPKAEQIVDASPIELRAIGLSNAKVAYVQNIARFHLEHGIDRKRFDTMTDDEIIIYLTQIKGIGRWTAEMLLMFSLGRPDVFAADDLGIQNAMIKLYNLDRADKTVFREELFRISSKWRPYRTFACLHLWHWKDSG